MNSKAQQGRCSPTFASPKIVLFDGPQSAFKYVSTNCFAVFPVARELDRHAPGHADRNGRTENSAGMRSCSVGPIEHIPH